MNDSPDPSASQKTDRQIKEPERSQRGPMIALAAAVIVVAAGVGMAIDNIFKDGVSGIELPDFSGLRKYIPFNESNDEPEKSQSVKAKQKPDTKAAIEPILETTPETVPDLKKKTAHTDDMDELMRELLEDVRQQGLQVQIPENPQVQIIDQNVNGARVHIESYRNGAGSTRIIINGKEITLEK